MRQTQGLHGRGDLLEPSLYMYNHAPRYWSGQGIVFFWFGVCGERWGAASPNANAATARRGVDRRWIELSILFVREGGRIITLSADHFPVRLVHLTCMAVLLDNKS